MKVTIEFNLPQEEERYDDVMNGAKWRYVVRELDEHIRTIIKWNSSELSESELEVASDIREAMMRYMEHQNLQL